MSIKRRITKLEARNPDPPPEPVGEDELHRPLLAPAIRELDKLIKRLEEHIREQEKDPEGFDEGYDIALYDGETIWEHTARVDALLEESDRRVEAWRAKHRPDLVGRGPTEIDKHIAEIKAEIREFEAQECELGAQKREGGTR